MDCTQKAMGSLDFDVEYGKSDETWEVDLSIDDIEKTIGDLDAKCSAGIVWPLWIQQRESMEVGKSSSMLKISKLAHTRTKI